jgi:hypothetical protein
MNQVDCRHINSYEDFIEDFIEAFNSTLFRPAGGNWNGNLDAFNDYLSWVETPYRLELLGTSRCEQILSKVNHERHGTALWPMLRSILLQNKDRICVHFN